MGGGARRRTAALLAGLWAGEALGVGVIAAPAIFAALPRLDAGQAVGAVLAIDAGVGLALGLVLLMLAVDAASRSAERGGSRFSGNAVLALGGLFCVLFGHYGLQPALAAARSGQGPLPFGALHGIATAFFGLKIVCATVLAWRLSGPLRAAATTS